MLVGATAQRSVPCQEGLDRHKHYYLVRMIPVGESWEETPTEMAFSIATMYMVWLPGQPMPSNLISDACKKLESVKHTEAAAAKIQSVVREARPKSK
jgi:hypothetical protein